MIELTDKPTPTETAAIRERLAAFNETVAGPHNTNPLCLLVRGAGGEVEGGLVATTFWQWLYIDLLFVPDGQRRHGLGSDLLRQAENEARRRGCVNAFVSTFSFQAKPFYEKHGYRACGEIPDFPPGHSQYVMSKRL